MGVRLGGRNRGDRGAYEGAGHVGVRDGGLLHRGAARVRGVPKLPLPAPEAVVCCSRILMVLWFQECCVDNGAGAGHPDVNEVAGFRAQLELGSGCVEARGG